MKSQSLFVGKNKKKLYTMNLLSAEFVQIGKIVFPMMSLLNVHKIIFLKMDSFMHKGILEHMQT